LSAAPNVDSESRPGPAPDGAAQPASPSSRVAKAVSDIARAVGAPSVWWLLGSNDIKARYRRSAFGQLWLTLSMGLTIAALGLLYAVLFKQDVTSYLPFIAISIITWQFFAGLINDGCSSFTGSEGYIKNMTLPLSIYPLRVVARNIVVLLHNIVLVPIVWVILDGPVSWAALLVIPGLLLVMINGFFIGLLLGSLAARYRDLPSIMINVMQLAFFMSPVIWKPEQLNAQAQAFVWLNPFSSFLAIVRDPLLGSVPTEFAYLVALGITLANGLLALLVFARARARIVYWL
jgi:ABC-type polysaccharide/polyol phosphate export permease